MFECCPNCGYKSPQSTEWNFSEWRITTQFGSIVLHSELQAKIFDVFWRKQSTQGITRERLVDIIFADDIDGGISATNIGHIVSSMRFHLVNIGIFIKRGGKGSEGYNLIFTTPEDAKEKAGARALRKDRKIYYKGWYDRTRRKKK